MKTHLKNTFYIVLLLLFFFMLVSLWGFFSAIYPVKLISAYTPKHFGVAYEEVSFRTEDNVLLRGWFILSPHPQAKTIILLHGYGADKGNILPSRLFLYPEYNLLFFDFRYFGESKGDYSTAGLDEVKDLRAAIQYLHSRGIHEVGVWGISMGGAVALMAAVQMQEIKAVIAESSYARLDLVANQYYQIPLLRYPIGMLMRFWAYVILGQDAKSVSPMDDAAQLTIPVLLIHSRNDYLIPFKHAELLQEALKNNPHAEFLHFETSPHGGREEGYETRIKQFLKKSLGQTGPKAL